MGGNTTDPVDDASLQPLVSVAKLTDYILKLVQLHLDYGKKSDNNGLIEKLKDNSSVETLKQFIADPQAPSLMIERLSIKDENEESDDIEAAYSIAINVHYSNAKAIGLALIKKRTVIEADKPLSSQLHSVTLTEDSPYETLHSFVSKVVAPFFKSYVRESGKLER